jgi:radical SAM protein with 4Fe4S-binding SPASM domain
VRRISYEVFKQRVHTAADKGSIPLRVMFELTYNCNFRCQHCYVPQSFRAGYRKSQLNTKQIFSVLGKLKEAGCLFLGLTGGEPFTRTDILEIIEYAKRLGFRVTINTNGSLLNGPIVRKLAKINPDKIDITLPGISKTVFEAITGVPGSHRAVFKAIEMLRNNRIPLGFKSCLLKQNSGEIKAVQKFARSLNVAHRLDTLLSCRLDGSTEPYMFGVLLPETENKKRKVNKIRSSDHCIGKEQNERSLFFCGAGRSQAAVTPAGELKLCLMISEPKFDILKLGFSKAWKMSGDFVKNSKPDNAYLCQGCEHRLYCSSCPARGWLHAKNFTSCDPFMRSWLEQQGEKYADCG